MKAFLKRLRHTFFPERCLFCGEVIYPDAVFCNRCAEEMYQPRHPKVCANCKKPFDECECGNRTVAVYFYEEGAEHAIKRMKFSGERVCAEQLAKLMAKRLRESGIPLPEVLTPVPLHWIDRYRRGFSQTQWLCKALSDELSIPAELRVLKKRRYTKKQHGLSQKERKKNLRGAFCCRDAHKIKGKRVLLIDDVTTTGSTLLEASRALKEADVAEIVCLAATKTRFTDQADL